MKTACRAGPGTCTHPARWSPERRLPDAGASPQASQAIFPERRCRLGRQGIDRDVAALQLFPPGTRGAENLPRQKQGLRAMHDRSGRGAGVPSASSSSLELADSNPTLLMSAVRSPGVRAFLQSAAGLERAAERVPSQRLWVSRSNRQLPQIGPSGW